jgi:hypothetical protein
MKHSIILFLCKLLKGNKKTKNQLILKLFKYFKQYN